MQEKYYTCKYDRAFKEVFLKESNKDLLKGLLECVLKVNINDIVVKPNERNTENLQVKRKTYDALLNTDIGKIEIEVNANAEKEYVNPRNMSYLCDLYSHHTLKGDEYDENTMIIQINFSYGLGKNKKSIRKYYIQDMDKVKYVKNFKIIELNMDYFLEIWYSKDRKRIKDNEYLVMLGLDKDELEELSLKSKDVKKYMEELNKINKDPEFREYMSWEEDQRKIFNSEMSYARREGHRQGLEEGIKEGRKEGIREKGIEVAKEMKRKKIDVDLISQITKLSKEEIERLI